MTEFTNETQLKNPAKKFITFKGTTGKWVYFDKSKAVEGKTKGENVELPLPMDFIMLDELATIKGYHDASDSGIYSNEVRDTTKDTLWVKSFGWGDIDTGIYSEIKWNLQWGKYSKSVYAMLDWELVNFNFIGISLSAWIEKGFSTRNVRISSEMTKGKKGANEYYIPKFEQVQPDEAKMSKAKDMFNELQAFLSVKLKTDKITYPEASTTTEPTVQSVDDDMDDLPFN